MDKKVWQWERTINSQHFLVSSDRALLPHSFVQEAFATEAMFWAKPMSDESLRSMLDNSLTLGIYFLSDTDTKTPIGMARLITDYTTLAYLTDVYLQPSHRAFGLGKWIIHCCREIALQIPDLRFMMLLTGSEQAQKLYRRELGMHLVDGQEEPLACMGVRKPKLADVHAASAVPQNGPSGSDA
ncbi:acetyltransferase [Pyrenochaeta sp. MPI-SDFR-AT-0127]|nr:acetyltransferase [Pyrenochaeta sp. MPI-SDFR-AT-0127]